MRAHVFLMLLMPLLAACSPALNIPMVTTEPPTAAPSAVPANAATALPTEASSPSSVPNLAQPTCYLEFSDLGTLQKAAIFPVRVPRFVPDDLPLDGAWIADFPDGSETVSVVYAAPGDPLDANRKMISYWMTKTDQAVSEYSVSHQFKVNALDIHEGQVRGRTGYLYWTQSVAAGNSAVLMWREEGINLSISMYGSWPEPDQNHPRGLDRTLLAIATSLAAVP